MSLDVLTQVWLCRISGYLAILFLLGSQSMSALRRLGWVSAKSHLLWRRRLGVYSAGLASLHVLIVWRTLLVGYYFYPFRETSWAQLGLGAWLLLLLLWLTSYPRLVRRLRVGAWRNLHRLAYLATLLGLAHALLAPWSDPRIHLVFLTLFTLMLILRVLPWPSILKR